MGAEFNMANDARHHVRMNQDDEEEEEEGVSVSVYM